MSNNYAIIIGAGPAGLAAAFRLLENGSGLHPVVLEADSCVGGISRTVEYAGNRLDIGGHRFFTKSQVVNDLWHRVLSPESGDFLVRPRVSHIFYNNRFFSYPLSLSWATLRNMGFGATLKAGCSYLSARLKKRPEVTLEDFYINRFGRQLYSTFFEDYTTKVWGVHPSGLGADWGAQRVKGLSVTALLKDMLLNALHIKNRKKETSLIEQFEYPKFGPGMMWERMADLIEALGGEILLDTRAVALNADSDGKISSVETIDPDGSRSVRPCRYVFSSMPIKNLVADIRGLSVPEAVAHAAEGLPYRDFITVGLLVEKLKIGPVPDTWIYIQEPGVKAGRLQILNNWSPYMVANPEKYTWIAVEYFCNEGDEMWTTPDPDFISMAINEMVKIGILDSPSDVLDSVEVRMPKAYPAYYGTYRELGIVKEWLDSIGNIFCIGRNGQHRYNNMDHSMLTGLLAADSAAGLGSSRTDIWNVNTDSDYHETKV